MRRLATVVFVLLAAAVGVGGWHFSDKLLRPAPARPLERDLRIAAADDSTLTLEGSVIAQYGERWFLEWPGGSAVLGERLGEAGGRVTRRYHPLEGAPEAGARVDLRAYPYRGDPRRTLGLEHRAVVLTTGLGQFPAWEVPGSRPTTFLFVHGMGASRAEALRVLPVVAALGYPSLVVSYRNDPGAPPAPDRLHHLGAAEWEEVEGFVRMTEAAGARRVVLVGFSMGGAVVAEFMRRSALAHRVAGVVLDAPVLDWSAVVARGVRKEGRLASLLAPVARGFVTARTGFVWRASGPLAWRQQFHRPVPVLLFHGTADETVPIATSEAFAVMLGARVTLVRTEGAGHVRSWNHDPAGYEDALREWIARVVLD